MRRAACAVLLFATACQRDLQLPEPLEEGTVRGRVMYSVPGRARREPAAGATVALLNTGVSGTTGADGRFKLTGVLQTEGSLLFRFTVPGSDGTARQKLLQLSDFKTRPNEGVDVGDVLVVENAAMHGRARLTNPPSVGGHSGIIVFVPEGPITTYTAADGTWSLNELPEGTLQLAFFQSGYAPVLFDSIETRGGEDVAVADVLLQKLTGMERGGSISGELVLVPDAPVSGAEVSARSVTGAVTAGTFSNAEFSVPNLPPGLYDVTLSRTGYAAVPVQNVLVFPERDTALGRITMTQMPPFDAGVRPGPPDGGPAPDGGLPPDSGTPDAGPRPDGGTIACIMHVDCPPMQWCDRGFCFPRCTSNGDCNDGRVCEPGTGTCVTPCAGGCDAGLLCVSNACRSVCDLSNPCPQGQRCNAQSACVPECTIDADCAVPFTTCGTGGQCRPSGACGTDVHCLRTDMCVGGVCNARMSPRSSDGGWLCDGGCTCRLDETCTSGFCQLEAAPTLFVAEDGGGNGTSPATPSSDLSGTVRGARYGDVIALRADDGFTVSQRLRLDAGTTLAGGYRVCGPNRWVRDESARTRVYANGAFVVQAVGADIKVRNLSLSNDAGAVCDFTLVQALGANRFEASHLDGTFRSAVCSGGVQAGLVGISSSTGYVVDDAVVDLGTYAPQLVTGTVFVQGGSGVIKNSRYRCAACYQPTGFAVTGATGLTTVSDCTADPGSPTAVGSQHFLGILLSGSAGPVVAERNVVRFAHTGGGTSTTLSSGIQAVDMADVTVRDNLIDGFGDTGLFTAKTYGIEVSNSRGRVQRNTVYFPSHTATNNATWIAILVTGPLAVLDVANNVIDGGTLYGSTGSTMRGIEVDNVTTGPLEIHHNSISLGTVTIEGMGIGLYTSPQSAGLRVDDNFIFGGSAISSACSSDIFGLYAFAATFTAERNVIRTGSGFNLYGAWLKPGSVGELYANVISTAPPLTTCTQAEAYALYLEGSSSVAAGYNTLTANGGAIGNHLTSGVKCDQQTGPVSFTANAIGGGGTTSGTAVVQSGVAMCSQRGNWAYNYFWHDRPAPAAVATDVAPGLTTDAGLPNWYGNNVSCLDPLEAQPTYKLGASSPCLDRGVPVLRRNGTPVLLDLESHARDGGNGVADLGAWERP